MPWREGGGEERGGRGERGGEEEKNEASQYIHPDLPLLSFCPVSSVQLDVEPTACVVASLQRELVLVR